MQGRKWVVGVVAGALAALGFAMAVHTPDTDAVRHDPAAPVTTISVVTTVTTATTPSAPPAPTGCGSVTTTRGVTTSAAPGEIAAGFRISAARTVTCLGVDGCWVQVVPPPGPDGTAPPLPEQHWVPADAVGVPCGTAD
jgi:hypothetical protein